MKKQNLPTQIISIVFCFFLSCFLVACRHAVEKKTDGFEDRIKELESRFARMEKKVSLLAEQKKNDAVVSGLVRTQQEQDAKLSKLLDWRKAQSSALSRMSHAQQTQSTTLSKVTTLQKSHQTTISTVLGSQKRQEEKVAVMERSQQEQRLAVSHLTKLQQQQKRESTKSKQDLQNLSQRVGELERWRRSAKVWFSSEPSEVEVWLDGQLRGTTPLTLLLEKDKTYQTIWKKNRFFSLETKEIFTKSEETKRVRLQSRYTIISLDSEPKGARLRLSQESTNKTWNGELPVRWELEKGVRYKGELRAEKYRTKKVSLELSRHGREANHHVWKLEPLEIEAGRRVAVTGMFQGYARYVPGGRFRMGASPEDDEREDHETPQEEVLLLQGYWMLETEVTQRQYKELMGINPSHFQRCGGSCPVESVSWHNAALFANRLSKKEKREQCFVCKDQHCKKVASYLRCKGWRLPSEAEWERAATWPKKKHHPLERMAWYSENAQNQTQVAEKMKPNDLGIKSLQGNVWEWVADGLRPYTGNRVVDPLQAGEKSYGIKGGGYQSSKKDLRPTARRAAGSTYRYNFLGFRLVRTGP